MIHRLRFGVALRIHCQRVTTSFESVERAHTSHALSCSASETVIGLRSVCLSRHSRFGNIQLMVLRCAPRLLGFDFRQVHHGFTPVSIHRHLTIRSSRPRVVASTACYALRLHAVAAPPQGGLTQALGGRKASCSCVVRSCDLSASVGVALRILSRRVATSFESVERAHTSHT